VNLGPAAKSRAAALAAGILVFLIPFFVLAGPSWGLALYRLMQDGGCTILWLIAAGGIGWIAWKISGAKSESSLALVSTVALGLGIMSLLILALGVAGWMNRIWAIAIIAAGILIAFWAIYPRAKQWDAGQWFAQPADWAWLWIAPAAVAGVTALAACFPPGLLWGDEPNGYDVVEYHLQIPREWYEAGRIIPLHHNVFSYFPFNVEMHYMLAMFLHGGSWGPWSGMYLAQMMHGGFCVMAVCAVCALSGGGKKGALAGALTAVIPWTGLVGAVAYNEGGTLLFGILAIGWAIRASSWREFALAGVLAGFAAGSKFSIAPFVFVAVPFAVIATRPKLWSGCAMYLFAAILTLSPWLIRNWRWSGNPVFPEAMSILGQGHFSDSQAERWREAYWPDPKYRSSTGRASALWYEVLRDIRFGWVLFPLGIAAAIVGYRNRTIVCLLILLILQTGFWTVFTHLQSRFMVIAIPITALMVVQIDFRAWSALVSIAVVGLAGLSIGLLTQKMGRYLEMDHTQAPLIGRENLEGFRLFDTRQLKDDQSLDLIGDAGAFWYQIPMSRLNYKTVFDVDTSDPTKTIDQDWLAGMPKGAVVWRDDDEMKRFAKTYYGMSGK
jgi:hypothetical protein